MKKTIHLLLLMYIVCFYKASLWGQGQQVKQQFIVSFANSRSVAEDKKNAEGFAINHNVAINELDKLTCIPFTYLWELRGNLNDVIATAEYIKKRPNGSNRAVDTTYNNPIQYRLSPLSCSVSKDSIDAYPSCAIGGDKPVLIAVIDDGMGDYFRSGRTQVDYRTFFKPHLWTHPTTGSIGYNFLNNTPSPINSQAKHGSAVTYRIVDMLKKAKVEKVQIMALQTHDPETGLGTLWNVCRALDFACYHKVNIINMSLAGLTSPNSSGEVEAVGTSALEVIIEYMRTKNILVVAAAGNDGENVTQPRLDNKRYCTASYKLLNLIEVAANARCSDALWSFSNRGAPNVHIAAPGENVYCAVPIEVNASGFMNLTGTSFAAPHVTAAAAILAANRPTMAFSYLPIVRSLIDPTTVTRVAQLEKLISSTGRLNTCKALKYFLQNYERLNGIMSFNTEGSISQPPLSTNAIKISPNPTNADLNIQLKSTQNADTYLILTDILGRVTLQQEWSIHIGDNVQFVDLSNLNKGVYFINIRIGTETLIHKVIKN